MNNRQKLYQRFAECYGATRPDDLVKVFKLDSSTISNWKTGKRPVPRRRLKAAVDSFNLSWDWLMDGKPPKFREKRYWDHHLPLDHREITWRFVALYEEMSDTEIAHFLSVSPAAVHYMKKGTMKTPWSKLKMAVDIFGTTWEWLLEGRGPKHRE